tara:strand:- start:26134 stop:27174 length:1041 start_codon:yes stop_codon:yes gene_type:complete
MTLRIIKIIASSEHNEYIKKLAEDVNAIDFWSAGSGEKGQKNFNILMSSDKIQGLTDKIQQGFNGDKDWRIVILPVETVIPRPEEPAEEENEKDKNASKKVSGGSTREALYDKIVASATINSDFIALVVLSTLVAAIGVITDNVTIVIGAMVLAPLLGPNLALSFGVTLGDKDMIVKSLKANGFGVGLTLCLAALIGFVIPTDYYIDSAEFISRTDVGFDAIALALAAGVAGVLSLTSGVSSAMVGVMVAVAMMPPAVVLGISLGSGLMGESYGAALLLAVNIICVNLSAKIVFTLKGISPRTWYQRKKTLQSLKLSLGIWGVLLLLLCALIYMWHSRADIITNSF